MALVENLKSFFSKKKSIAKVTIDELRREKVKLDQEEGRLIRQVEYLDRKKQDLFVKGKDEPSQRQHIIAPKIHGDAKELSRRAVLARYGFGAAGIILAGSAVDKAGSYAGVDRNFGTACFKNVLDFGAQLDGVADDTEALQAAVAGGGEILIPDLGAFGLVTDEIPLESGTRIIGCGHRPEVRQMTPSKSIFTGQDLSDISLQNLTLTGPDSQMPSASLRLVGNLRRIFVEDCHIQKWTTGISLWAGTRAADITDVHLTRNLFDHCVVRGIEDAANGWHGYYVQMQGPDNVQTHNAHVRDCRVIGNVFLGEGRASATPLTSRGIVGINSFSHNVIAFNHFEGWEHNAIVLAGSEGQSNVVANWNIVTGNTFRHLRTGTGRAIFLFVNCNYNLITDNDCQDIVGDAIHLFDECTGNVVARNQIHAAGDGNGSTLGGIRLDGNFQCILNEIRDNVIIGAGAYGIALGNAPSNILEGNLIEGNGLLMDPPNAHGILLAWSAENSVGNNVVIRRNMIRRSGRSAIYIEGRSRGVIIRDNVIRNVSVNRSNTYDGVSLNTKTIGATTESPFNAVIEGNTISDDPAFGDPTTRYAVRLSDSAITGVEIRNNDLRNLNQSAVGAIGGALADIFEGNRLTNGPRSGVATLVRGAVTINTSEAIGGLGGSFFRVRLTAVSPGTQRGELYVSSVVSGASFTIRSTNAGDDRVVFWEIVH